MTTSVDACLATAQACLARGEGEQALCAMQEAAQGAPDNPAVLAGLGVALRFNGQLAAAAEAFSRCLAVQPQRADAQVYLGMIRLAQGQQKEGWALYRARWRYANWTEKLRYPQETLWQGRVGAGMRLLLWCEQGFGDAIQFARYAPWLQRLLHAQGGSLVLEAPAPLCALLRDSWPFMEIVASGQVRGRFDAHLPLLDLPLCWGGLVGAEGLPYVPLPLPYLSALPDPRAEQRGAVRLPVVQERALRVGIAWQGRPTHPDDRWRSVQPDQLTALFDVPGVRWVSLQKDGQAHPTWLPDDLAQCRDFADTARIIDTLDLVISIDSAIAHLAGALDKPVWLLLPRIADWRWQLTGESTPWYPGMRLFRQGAEENWAAVATRVAAALATTADWSLRPRIRSGASAPASSFMEHSVA